MYQEFHHRDWLALINKVLRQTGHQRIHIKKVLQVAPHHVSFITCQGATILAPTFNSIHGHGIGFLALLRLPNTLQQASWERDTGQPIHHCQLLVKTQHNFTAMLYPSLRQIEHWLWRQYGEGAASHRAPFEKDIERGFIGQYPAIVDIQRQLSYPVI